MTSTGAAGGPGPVEHLAVGGDVALPFVCRLADGTGDPAVTQKARLIQSALSRICAVCASPLTRPIAFVGSEVESEEGLFAFGPTHVGCAQAIGEAGRGSVVVTTGGFDVVRPTRRGGPVLFKPNSVLATARLTSG